MKILFRVCYITFYFINVMYVFNKDFKIMFNCKRFNKTKPIMVVILIFYVILTFLIIDTNHITMSQIEIN